MIGRSSFIFGATFYPILSGTALAAPPTIGFLFFGAGHPGSAQHVTALRRIDGMTIAKGIFALIFSQFSVAEMRPMNAEGWNQTTHAIGLRLKDIPAEFEEHATTTPPKSACMQIYPGKPSSLRITLLIRALISPSDLRRSATSGSNITFSLCLRWLGCRAGRPRFAVEKMKHPVQLHRRQHQLAIWLFS